MKHQNYALTTALIITIIGLIVTIDYFSGINKEVYKQIEVLKTDIAELKIKSLTIKDKNHGKYFIWRMRNYMVSMF
jgi:hypothetical protein